MGYFTILAAIPGFFLSSLILMLLWGVIAPDFGIEKLDYPNGYVDNYYPLVSGGTSGGSWSKRNKVAAFCG